jgi:hypothetical protein
MSELQDKSEKSVIAAGVLQDKQIYHSAVHCLYYSCVQLMNFILVHKFKDPSFWLAVQNKETNSHNEIITAITNDIAQKPDSRKRASILKSNIIALKTKRREADYTEIKISVDDFKAANDLCVQVRSTLKNVYQIA